MATFTLLIRNQKLLLRYSAVDQYLLALSKLVAILYLYPLSLSLVPSSGFPLRFSVLGVKFLAVCLFRSEGFAPSTNKGFLYFVPIKLVYVRLDISDTILVHKTVLY